MRCAIVQPHYLPWVGYFEMIDRVDVFVLFDDVDFIKREWKNRNRIRMERTGDRTRWLTVPIVRDDQRNTPICRARIDTDRPWAAAHARNLEQTYRKTRYFSDYLPALTDLLQSEHTTLAELNARLLRHLCGVLGIDTRIVRASDLGVSGRKTERLANVCQAVGADAYLANNGSSGYLDPSVFEERGIRWRYQDYTHPTYAQWSVWREGRPGDLPWVPYLSVVDLLVNHGPDALDILRSGRPVDDA